MYLIGKKYTEKTASLQGYNFLPRKTSKKLARR